MNNLQNSQQHLGKQIHDSNLKASLAIVMDRTDLQITNIDAMINDIKKEFANTSENDIIKALRNGSLGKYGRSYRLSIQEVCFWIRCFKKEISDNTLKL